MRVEFLPSCTQNVVDDDVEPLDHLNEPGRSSFIAVSKEPERALIVRVGASEGCSGPLFAASDVGDGSRV